MSSLIREKKKTERKKKCKVSLHDSTTSISNENELRECEGKRWLRRKALDLQEHQITISKAPKEIMYKEEKIRKAPKELTATEKRLLLSDMCDECCIPMKVISNDSLLGCPKCAKTRIIPVSYVINEGEYISNSGYHQKNRLLEWLEFTQAKEYTEPCEKTLHEIMAFMVKKKITGFEDSMSIIKKEYEIRGVYKDANSAIKRLQDKIPDVEKILKQCNSIAIRLIMQEIAKTSDADNKIRKFYERSPKFSSYISGFWPLRFSNAQEETIRKLYTLAAPVYEKYKKPSQPNWPGGYSYFLRNLCVLLGWDEYIHHFALSSGQKNVVERERVRKLIWTELNWEYVPTNYASIPPSSSLIGKRKRMLSEEEE